jgi:hypothetical protein
MTITKTFGIDFYSSGGALTLDPYCIREDMYDLPGEYVRTHDNQWTIAGKVKEDYYEWINEFEAEHPVFGRVWGDFEGEVYADTEEGYQDFYKNFPPTAWDYWDI